MTVSKNADDITEDDGVELPINPESSNETDDITAISSESPLIDNVLNTHTSYSNTCRVIACDNFEDFCDGVIRANVEQIDEQLFSSSSVVDNSACVNLNVEQIDVSLNVEKDPQLSVLADANKIVYMENGEPYFPVDILEQLEEMIGRTRWIVPVLPKAQLEVLLDAAILLAQTDRLDTRSSYCQRFFKDGLTQSFIKIFTDEAVTGWKYEIQKCILLSAKKLIELIVVKLDQDWFVLLDLLHMIFNAESKFHIYNSTKQPDSVWPSNFEVQYALPRESRTPMGWLVDLVNHFGSLDGFKKLEKRFHDKESLNVAVIAALVRPFGACYEVLTRQTVEIYFKPLLTIVAEYIKKLTDEDLKKESKTEFKNDTLSSIIRALQNLMKRIPGEEETIRKLEEFRLQIILRLLQVASFNGKMNALNELNKAIGAVNYYPQRHIRECEDWMTSEKIATWIQLNDVLGILLRENLHQPQYVEKIEKIIRFMIKEKALTAQDLNRIWEAQAGKHEAIVKNIHGLLIKLAWDFSPDQLDQLFDCFQHSWTSAERKPREKLLDLIRHLAEDDKEGVMAQKVLGLVYNLAKNEDCPTDIMDQALHAHIKILDYSCSQDRDTQKMQWIDRLVEELKSNDRWVVPALKQIKEICSLYSEPPQNYPHHYSRSPNITYRNQVVNKLQKNHSIVMLVSTNLMEYMACSREYIRNAALAGLSITASEYIPDGRYPHTQQVLERLRFLRFLLKDGMLWLCEPQALQIWESLAVNAIWDSDREACFKWFTKLMGDEQDLDPDITRTFFENVILRLDPALLTENGMCCFERFFRAVNIKESKLQIKRRGFVMEDINLVGTEYLWRIVIHGIDSVASYAIRFIKDTFSNLGPKLQMQQCAIHEDFIAHCFERLRASYDTVRSLRQDTISSSSSDAVNNNNLTQLVHINRMVRVLTVLQEYVQECDERYPGERLSLPLALASRGKSFRVVVKFHPTRNQFEEHEHIAHSSETLGALRRAVLQGVKTTYNYEPEPGTALKLELNFNGEMLDVADDRRLLINLGFIAANVLTGKLSTTASNLPSSPESSSDSSPGGSPRHSAQQLTPSAPLLSSSSAAPSSLATLAQNGTATDMVSSMDGPNVELEGVLPGVLLARSADRLPFLLQLTELGIELGHAELRQSTRALLQLMPADDSTQQQLLSVTKKFSALQTHLTFSSSAGSKILCSELKQMLFERSACEVVYTLEVLYALLVPAADSLTEQAVEFQHNLLLSGGVPLFLEALCSNNFMAEADLYTRRLGYTWLLRLLKLLLTTLATLCYTLSIHEEQSLPEVLQHVGQVLASALQVIPRQDTELFVRQIAHKTAQLLSLPLLSTLPDLITVKCIMRIAWAACSGSLNMVHSTAEDIHRALERTLSSSADQLQPPLLEEDDVTLTREALETLCLCVALCPTSLEQLNKEKGWKSFIIDTVLLCANGDVRHSAQDVFVVLATRCSTNPRAVHFFVTLLITVLNTLVCEYACHSQEYFYMLEKLLNHMYTVAHMPISNAESMLKREIDWLLKVRDAAMQTKTVGGSAAAGDSGGAGGNSVDKKNQQQQLLDDNLLQGHLKLCKELLAFCKDKKYYVGSSSDGPSLVQMLIEDFLFPASRQILALRISGQLNSDDTSSVLTTEEPIVVCHSPQSIAAALDLLVALATDCLQNLQCLVNHLVAMYYGDSIDNHLTEWEYLPPVGQRPQGGFVGLKNAGATCYMNSVMQQLFMIVPLRNAVLSVDTGCGEYVEDLIDDGISSTNQMTPLVSTALEPSTNSSSSNDKREYNLGVLRHLQAIFGHLSSSRLQYYIPKGFWKHFKLCGEPVNLREQHDAVEFFSCLTDTVDDAFKALGHSKVIERVMGGMFADQKICKDCPHRYSRDESFTVLNLDIRNHQNIIESLEQYVKGDLLEGANAYHCEKCNKKVDTVKRTCFKKLPPIFVIQLKRFDYDWEREAAIKFNDYFEFPRELDMEPYTTRGLARQEGEVEPEEGGGCSSDVESNTASAGTSRYNLTGVVVHSGQASGGHYFSHIKTRAAEASTDMPLRWYKFDDNEVLESKIEEDEEMRNQCFGGEYVGEVYDHVVKRMQVRKHKRWWNAYILVYEREDFAHCEEMKELARGIETLSLAQQQQSFSSGSRLPKNIDRLVRAQNVRFMHNKAQFTHEYFAFVRKLVQSNARVVHTALEQRLPAFQLEEIALTCVRFAAKFLFSVGLRTKKNLRGSATEWHDALLPFFRLSARARLHFAQVAFFEAPNRFAEYLLECPTQEVRSVVARFIVTLAHLSRDTPYRPATLEGEPSHSLTHQLIASVLRLVSKEVLEHSRHLKEYLQLFWNYLQCGLEERRHLLQLNVPALFINIALNDNGPSSSTTSSIKYQTVELSKLFMVVSALIRCCDTSMHCLDADGLRPQVPNPYLEERLEGTPLMPLSDHVAQLLLYPAANCGLGVTTHHHQRSFLKKMLEEGQASPETPKLLRFLAWENEQFSIGLLAELTHCASMCYTYELRPYLDYIFEICMIEDSFQTARIFFVFDGSEDNEGLLTLIQRNKSHHQKRAYQCLKLMTQLLGDCSAAMALLEQKEDLRRRYQHCVEWLHDELERRPAYPSNQYYSGAAGAPVGTGSVGMQGWANSAGGSAAAIVSNETSQGFYLERSNSARHTLAKACQFLPADEEVEEEGWESGEAGECSASDASGVPSAVSLSGGSGSLMLSGGVNYSSSSKSFVERSDGGGGLPIFATTPIPVALEFGSEQVISSSAPPPLHTTNSTLETFQSTSSICESNMTLADGDTGSDIVSEELLRKQLLTK